MSVVAWDGKTIAADRQGTVAGMRHLARKICLLPVVNSVVAWTGTLDQGVALSAWFTAGADPRSWPEFQKDKEDWTRLIVATPNRIYTYERLPVLQEIEDSFFAWGSGRDFAMGALAHGADAVTAVEIASAWDAGCGLGVDAFSLQNGVFVRTVAI